MKKIFSLTLFLGLALGLNSAIFAQDGTSPNSQEKMNRQDRMGKMRSGKGDRNGMMGGLEGLNLTDAQKQQIQNLRRNNQSGEANRGEMRQLMQAKRAGTLTAEQENRLTSLREQARANSAEMREQILAILTSEQRQQLQQSKQDGTDREGGRMRGGNRRLRDGAMRGGLQGLNLTDAQKEQLRNLRANDVSDNATHQEMLELREAKRNGTLTAEQENRLKSFKQQKRADSEKRHQQILAILTPEQRRQFEQNKAQRKEQMKQRRQNRTQNSPMDNNN